MSTSTNWSRAEPASLVRAARAMYEHGQTSRQVLEAIYGVDLPTESRLILRDFVSEGKDLGVSWRINPWELMIPLEEGGPKEEPGPRECAEAARAYQEVPQVVLLGRLGYHGVALGNSIVGYDLDEVRAGRSTIVGLRNVPKLTASPLLFTRFGPSLLDVLRELVASYLALAKQRFETDNHEDVDAIADQLASVEALQRELAR